MAYEWAPRGLTAFLENLALVSDQDTLPDEADKAVTLLTLHTAKGLEFSQVFIIGLDDGLLPHSRSKDDVEEMAEERRLFYVGLTRAKDRLYLVRAQQRSTYGSFDTQYASPFLDDIPEGLLQRQGLNAYNRSANGGSRPKTWMVNMSRGTSSAGASAPIVEQRYHPGDRVQHPVWEAGIVMDSRLQDGDEHGSMHCRRHTQHT